MGKFLLLGVSHLSLLVIGFAAGIYVLPIITAQPSPDSATLREQASDAIFHSEIKNDLRGHDFLHWGEGRLSITPEAIVHEGSLAPGPSYKLYLVKSFVEHEDEFLPIKDQSLAVGDIRAYEGFVLDLPEDVDITEYTTLLIWCETFSEFITAAQYRS